MQSQSTSTLGAADREIVGTHLFAAPRALVCQTWIDPDHLKKLVGAGWIFINYP